MAGVTQITRGEFLQFFQRCLPPGGWPRRIAVANSAGPDSVCLLYLMSNLVREAGGRPGLPEQVWSLHINHGLQEANVEMAKCAHKMAEKCGAPHCAISIPWGENPFPPRPGHGEPVEEIARAARHNRLFQGVLQVQVHSIAFGHHADDQVETAIMRIIMGSGELGISGMKPVRRWGMGNGGLEAAGAAGMDHWIVRPLLEVSKDRILATCEANGLEYVTDMTNFQPALTLRNHVRQYLAERERPLESLVEATQSSTSEGEAQIENAVEKLSQYAEGNGRLSHLREAVRQVGYKVGITSMQASLALTRSLLPSPPSTVLLSKRRLHETAGDDVRREVIRRILRYVSPRPWGAPTAVAGGSRTKLDLIVQRVWEDTSTSNAFSLGSRVRWVPLIIRPNGSVRMPHPLKPGEYDGWLVMRDNPWSVGRIANGNEPVGATEDYTQDILRSDKEKPGCILRWLYDARFCIEFDLDKTPRDVLSSLADPVVKGRIIAEPTTQWTLPKVIWRREGLPDRVLAEYKCPRLRDWTVDSKPVELTIVPWMRMYFIRTIEAL